MYFQTSVIEKSQLSSNRYCINITISKIVLKSLQNIVLTKSKQERWFAHWACPKITKPTYYINISLYDQSVYRSVPLLRYTKKLSKGLLMFSCIAHFHWFNYRETDMKFTSRLWFSFTVLFEDGARVLYCVFVIFHAWMLIF